MICFRLLLSVFCLFLSEVRVLRVCIGFACCKCKKSLRDVDFELVNGKFYCDEHKGDAPPPPPDETEAEAADASAV